MKESLRRYFMIRPIEPAGSQPLRKKEASRELMALSEQVEEASEDAFSGLQKASALRGRISFDRGVKRERPGKANAVFSRVLRTA
ncbi:MAG: hypothetical protein A3E80_01510 [Chlamydiae bacterium RIFCSPHIGHO2_12_FULL_49_9]|nr:MAG: hypothetical protein A3E80_01510 [Chlamydiae bacterium RIFCSPHIGHO2_12_FULL_49_9]